MAELQNPNIIIIFLFRYELHEVNNLSMLFNVQFVKKLLAYR